MFGAIRIHIETKRATRIRWTTTFHLLHIVGVGFHQPTSPVLMSVLQLSPSADVLILISDSVTS
jgi:hypothetical protein